MSEEVSEREKKNLRSLTKVFQFKGPLDECLDERCYLFFCFLCYSELSEFEILGLTWQDIDFAESVIHVNRIAFFAKEPKELFILQNVQGIMRSIPIQSELIRRIQPYRQQEGYIVPYDLADRNKPITWDRYDEDWIQISKVIGLPYVEAEGFRVVYNEMSKKIGYDIFKASELNKK